MLDALIPDGLDPETLLAIDDHGASLRYGDLDHLKKTWASKVPGRCLVALFCSNSIESLGAYIGLHAAGHVVILLSGKMNPAVREDLVARYGVEVLVEDGNVTLVKEPSGGLHPDLSVCLSTSGSTGSPKLVQFSTAQLVANAEAIANYLQLTPVERPLTHLPFEYSFGLSVVHSHMAVGATLLLTEHGVMQKPFWERLAEATSLAGVPFHFEMLLRMRLGRADLPNLKVLTQAGGKIGEKEARAIYALAEEKGWKFHIMYGQTEAGPRISWLPFSRMEENFDSIGEPIPGVQLDIAKDGELVVRSPSVMLGYAQSRADLALGDQLGGSLHTGDIAEEMNGLYKITGRKSRFIKLQGNRVGLDDVENRMAAAGHNVWCVGRDDALTMLTEDLDTDRVRLNAVDLFSFPARSLEVRNVAQIPRRGNGKVDYAALQAMVEGTI
ncbi:AMP-binding protein [Ponticoccus alexandrii]|uniref:AMP-binding protein n=1 Tax=Ponticoccus alexandrii TaxID=1943633 RepID=A0ABX7FE67_9RHOB|nr:AMP-binding protein [Ponticoccus alexandrii]QRF68683.1 AMP-binding protein [Ponticoccus alexandrii]